MIKSIWKLLADPAVLALVVVAAFVAGASGRIVGSIEGETRATKACAAEDLQKQLNTATAERNLLQARLNTLSHLAQSDAARAAEAAKADTANKEMVRATPQSDRACLDAAAARRLRQIR